MKKTTTEKLSFWRVRIDEEYYCDVIPSAEDEYAHDFVLCKIGHGIMLHMFATAVEDAEEAEMIAMRNASTYIAEYESAVN